MQQTAAAILSVDDVQRSSLNRWMPHIWQSVRELRLWGRNDVQLQDARKAVAGYIGHILFARDLDPLGASFHKAPISGQS